jgi:hypothetical protein
VTGRWSFSPKSSQPFPADLWRDSGFRRLYRTRLTGQAGDGVFQAGLAGFLLFSPERATTPGSLAAAAAVLLLPYSLVGPIAGVLIDRISRVRVLTVANVLRAVVLFAIFPVEGSGYAGVGFYGLVLVAFAINRFILSALSASLPGVVPADRLITGNALSTTSGTLATVVGAGIGAGIAAAGHALLGNADRGESLTAATAVAVYLAAAASASRLPKERLGPHDPPTTPAWGAIRQAFGEVWQAAQYLWKRQAARAALATQTAHRFWYGLWTVQTVLLFRNSFHSDGGVFRGGGSGVGQVVVATGIGSLLAALLTPRVTRGWPASRWFAVLLIVGGLTIAILDGGLLGSAQSPARWIAAALVLGFVGQGTKVCTDTVVQRDVADSFRGRAFAFYDQLFNVSYVAAAAAGAALLPATGDSAAMTLLAATGYLVTGLVYGATAERR